MFRLRQKTWKKIGIVAALGSILLLGVALLQRWQQRRKGVALSQRLSFQMDGIAPQIRGLTEEQATALLPATTHLLNRQDDEREFLKQAIRQTLFTIFNFNLFAMLIVNLLLDNPIGVFLNIILLGISMALRIFQVTYTKRHMDEIVHSLQPRASVIREGQLRSIHPARIVPGDYLVIGNGDEILVDGSLTGDTEIEIEQMNAGGTNERIIKRPGDTLKAGSYCSQGSGIYISQKGGWQHQQSENTYHIELLHSKRTPLQRLTENILRILLGIVLIFSALLILDTILTQPLLTNAVYRDAFSIIFGVAPTGLFMVLILKNIIGVLRISSRGALVYDPQSIETLAQVKTLCISKESLVKGLQVTLKVVESEDGEPPLSENIIRQILGDIAHSAAGYSTTMQMLAQALPGEQRRVKEMAPFWNHLGWYGLTFEDADRHGTYILGQQDVLSPHLRKERLAVGERVEAAVMDAGQGIGRFLRRFSHRDGEIEPSQNAAPRTGTLTEDIPAGQESEAALDVAESVVGQRLRTTLVRWLTPIEELPENLDQPAESTEEETQVLLAYLPKAVSFYDRKGRPDLPDDLIPLTRVQVNETIRPEAKQTLKALFDEGIQIKILAADPPEKVLPIIKALEIPEEQIRMVSGTDLPEKTDLAKAIPETLIFTNLTPAQKAEVVKSSRLQESYTMMIGSEVSDVLALRQAYLGVTTRSGAQAVLQQADIVLLDESIAALPRVFSEGQRMINGVLITFKLQISKVLMQLLLICFLLFNILDYFPYLPAQAGVASVFTITIPNIFLVVWASARRLTQESMRRQLLRFIIPVALSITILVSMIFTYFDEGTGDPAYANLAVTYALLLAGWLRVLFVLPPHRIWAGGTELRGDLRVYRVVLGSALLLIGFLIFPFFQDSFKISLLASWGDFFIVVMAIIAWAMILRIIWRLGSRE